LSGDAGPQDQERNRLNVELKLGSEASGMQGEFYRATDGAVQSSAFYVAAFRTMSAGIGQVQPAIRYEHIERSDAERQDEMRLLTFGMGIFLDGHRSKLQASYQADLRSGFAEGGLRIQYQAEF
jgi:hypothetical protein